MWLIVEPELMRPDEITKFLRNANIISQIAADFGELHNIRFRAMRDIDIIRRIAEIDREYLNIAIINAYKEGKSLQKVTFHLRKIGASGELSSIINNKKSEIESALRSDNLFRLCRSSGIKVEERARVYPLKWAQRRRHLLGRFRYESALRYFMTWDEEKMIAIVEEPEFRLDFREGLVEVYGSAEEADNVAKLLSKVILGESRRFDRVTFSHEDLSRLETIYPITDARFKLYDEYANSGQVGGGVELSQSEHYRRMSENGDLRIANFWISERDITFKLNENGLIHTYRYINPDGALYLVQKLKEHGMGGLSL